MRQRIVNSDSCVDEYVVGMERSEGTFATIRERIMMVSSGQRIPRVASAPLLSSERSGWSRLRMERHRMERAGDGAGVIDGHQICYNLTGPVPMRWQLTGRWLNGTLNKGDLCLATHGEFRSVSWDCGYGLLLLSLSPSLLSEAHGGRETGRGTGKPSRIPGSAHREHLPDAAHRPDGGYTRRSALW